MNEWKELINEWIYEGVNWRRSYWMNERVSEWVSERASEWVSEWASEWVSEWIIDSRSNMQMPDFMGIDDCALRQHNSLTHLDVVERPVIFRPNCDKPIAESINRLTRSVKQNQQQNAENPRTWTWTTVWITECVRVWAIAGTCRLVCLS